jgi:hypothetical protein
VEAIFVTIEHHRGTAAVCAIFLLLLATALRGKRPW